MSAAIRDGLAAIRTAALNGDLAALDAISAALETNLAELQGLSAEELEAIGRAAAENVPRLEAALRGVRAARRRIAEVAGAERPSTYDHAGRRQGLLPPSSGRRL